MKAFAMNILLAVFWLFLSKDAGVSDFMAGYLFGFLLMAIFRDVLDCGEYVRRTLALIRFTFVFVVEYLKANVQMAWMVLARPNRKVNSGMIEYSVEGLSPMEILILSHVISLTPGSTTVEISADFRVLLLHLFDVSNPDEARAVITKRFRDGILAITRTRTDGGRSDGTSEVEKS